MSTAGVLPTGVVKIRNRRTSAEITQLEQQLYEVLEADHPQSVRHVFYRMTDPRLPVFAEKSEQAGLRALAASLTGGDDGEE